jgi:uncharacterized membrane protein YczE
MKVSKLLIGQVVTSFAIAMVINGGLGVFPITATNLAVCGWFGISYGVANMITEALALVYAVYRGEKFGWATLLSCFTCGALIDVFMGVLPTSYYLIPLGLICTPIGYAITGSCGMGENATCMLQTALQKQFNKSTGFIRTVMEVCYLIVGVLGARSSITWFSIVLSVTFGTIVNTVYKVMKYEPTKVKQNYIKLGLTKRIQ